MIYRIFKKTLKLGLLQSIIFLTLLQPVHAVDCNITTDADPSPVQIICPLAKILSVLVYAGGALFIVTVFITAYKLAMSQGDPKGIQGARDTATYAVFGFIIVIGVVTILKIIQVAFGLNTAVLDPITSLETYIKILASKACICIDGSYTDPSPVCTLLFPCH